MSSRPRALILSAALAALGFADARAATDQSAPKTDGPSATQKLQEVTVTAQRVKLEKRVEKFVSKVSQPLFDGSLVRWEEPVCPLVSGLPRDEGEFILARVSDVARAAGVPLAGEKCHANLYILVNARPKELLRAMRKRNLWFTFGFDAPPMVIREFISKPGPVRVLYRDGSRMPSHPLVYSAKVGPITMSGDTWRYDGHSPFWDAPWQVFRAFVILDGSQLKGMTLGQVADYAAMVGLAQIRPADSLGDAPTILKLFSGAPQAAPAGMTDWDRAFLKSVYTTNLMLHGARWHIAHAMVSEIAH